MCDFHEGVVDGDTEVVNWHPIAPHNDKVPQRVRIPGNIATNAILYHYALILDRQTQLARDTECAAHTCPGNAKTITVRLTRIHHLLHFVFRCRGPFAAVLWDFNILKENVNYR